MRVIAAIVVAVLALAFGVVNGVLMCVSPRQHAAFWRWYSRIRDEAPRNDYGVQIETRTAGVVIVVVCVFFGWILVEKIVGR